MRSLRRPGMIWVCLTRWDLLRPCSMLGAAAGVATHRQADRVHAVSRLMYGPEGARSSVDKGHTHQEPHRVWGSGASSTELSAASRAELRPAFETHAGRRR